MIAISNDPKTASVRVEHSHTSITMEIYIHMQNSRDRIAAYKSDKALDFKK